MKVVKNAFKSDNHLQPAADTFGISTYQIVTINQTHKLLKFGEDIAYSTSDMNGY